jgi:hypothetical protein
MKGRQTWCCFRPLGASAFVPQLEVSHQMYNAESPGEKASWISTNYPENKRQNAKILRDKGLSGKHRMYEVRRISHSGGDALPDGPRGDTEILDLCRFMDRFIDMLDAWVDRGVKPPPTRSDWLELGDVDRDGDIEHPALASPEVACPLGVYHQFPASSGAAPGSGSACVALESGCLRNATLVAWGRPRGVFGTKVSSANRRSSGAWRPPGLPR